MLKRQISQSEIEALQLADAELRGLGMRTTDQKNIEVLADYLNQHPEIPLTRDRIVEICMTVLKSQLSFKSPAEQLYDAAASGRTDSQLTTFHHLLAGSDLVNTGDEGFANSAKILNELRGREVNHDTFYQAVGRLNYKPGERLHYKPHQPAVNPRSHKSDGEPFLGHVNESRYQKLSRERREREETERKAHQQPSDGRDGGGWRLACEAKLRGGPHSQQAEMQQALERGVSQGLSYLEIYKTLERIEQSRQRLISRAPW